MTATIAGRGEDLERAGVAKPPPPSLEDTSLPLLMMLDATSGSEGTVPVTSRRAYSLPSAGARSTDWPVSTMPMRFNWSRNSASLRSVR